MSKATPEKIEDLLRKISLKIPVYSGFDTSTSEKEYCWKCGEKPEKLLRCGRCHLARYCNRECQKEHFSSHKSECKNVSKATKLVETCRQELEHMTEFMGGEPENAFETSVGIFWGVIETRSYMKAREELVSVIRYIADRIETKSLWNSVLDHQLDMLRLCEDDNLGVRDNVPSVLLALNRDDDCNKFIRYWVKIDKQVAPEPWPEPWVNNTDMDRYADPMHDDDGSDIRLSHMIALLIVKLRIVEAYEAHTKTIQDMLAFDDLVRENIVKMSVCCDIEEQRALRKKYLQMLHKRNKYMLPSFVDPAPMQAMSYPTSYSPGDIDEARMNIGNYFRHVLRIPSARIVIKDFLEESS